MKKLIIGLMFLVIVQITAININAQTYIYHKFVDTSKVWTIINEYNQGTDIYTTIYKIGSDTIKRNNNIYFKVYSTQDSIINKTWKNIGYIREDSSRKVYVYDINKNDEAILYDFNVTTNQMLDNTKLNGFNNCNATSLVVKNIDSILVGNDYRVRINFANNYWIEGIGSNKGFLLQNSSTCAGSLPSLLCYSENNSVALKLLNYSSCFYYKKYPTSINENNSSNPISLSPNPARDVITINSQESIKEIEIYDVVGKRMNSPFEGGKGDVTRINISNFPSGIYFLVANGAGGVFRSKFVKQ